MRTVSSVLKSSAGVYCPRTSGVMPGDGQGAASSREGYGEDAPRCFLFLVVVCHRGVHSVNYRKVCSILSLNILFFF